MQRSALISPCGLFRYWLTRTWGDGPHLVFVLLNPSRGDAEIDDATILTCVRLAQREGYAGLIIVNLFAWRAREPREMLAAVDPVGPDNDEWLTQALIRPEPIVCAWGAHGAHRSRDQHFLALAESLGARRRLLTRGLTQGGQPKHPLYMRADEPLVPRP